MNQYDLKQELAGVVVQYEQGGWRVVTPSGFRLIEHPEAPYEAYLFETPEGDKIEVPCVIDFVVEGEPEKGGTWHIFVDVSKNPLSQKYGNPNYSLHEFISDICRALVRHDYEMHPDRPPYTIDWRQPE